MAISVGNSNGLIVMRPFVYIQGLKDLIAENFHNKQGLIGVEIGSFQGESAEIFLQSNAFAKLYCIDSWQNGYDNSDAASNQAEQAESAFDRRFQGDSRVVKIKGFSYDVANQIPNNIDFLYIDGNHQPEAVKQDLELYACKIKAGGIIAGHDYEPARYSSLMVVVDEFLGHKPEHVYCDFSWTDTKA